MGFSGTGIALHQKAGCQQFLKVESRRCACRRVSHLDRNGHGSTQTLRGERGLTIRSQSVERPRGDLLVFHTTVMNAVNSDGCRPVLTKGTSVKGRPGRVMVAV